MRAVLDTNILTRVATSRSGPAGEVYDHLRTSHLSVTSIPILSELKRVLAYPRLRSLHGLNDEKLVRFVSSVAADSFVVSLPDLIPRVVPDDADDDILVATAVASSANVLCTRNRHLFHPKVREYCERHGIQVMDDLELLKLLRSQDNRQDPSSSD